MCTTAPGMCITYKLKKILPSNCMLEGAHVCERQKTTSGIGSFPCVSLGGQTQVFRLCSKHFYWLSHLADPNISFQDCPKDGSEVPPIPPGFLEKPFIKVRDQRLLETFRHVHPSAPIRDTGPVLFLGLLLGQRAGPVTVFPKDDSFWIALPSSMLAAAPNLDTPIYIHLLWAVSRAAVTVSLREMRFIYICARW